MDVVYMLLKKRNKENLRILSTNFIAIILI